MYHTLGQKSISTVRGVGPAKPAGFAPLRSTAGRLGLSSRRVVGSAPPLTTRQLSPKVTDYPTQLFP